MNKENKNVYVKLAHLAELIKSLDDCDEYHALCENNPTRTEADDLIIPPSQKDVYFLAVTKGSKTLRETVAEIRRLSKEILFPRLGFSGRPFIRYDLWEYLKKYDVSVNKTSDLDITNVDGLVLSTRITKIVLGYQPSSVTPIAT